MLALPLSLKFWVGQMSEHYLEHCRSVNDTNHSRALQVKDHKIYYIRTTILQGLELKGGQQKTISKPFTVHGFNGKLKVAELIFKNSLPEIYFTTAILFNDRHWKRSAGLILVATQASKMFTTSILPKMMCNRLSS